MKTEDNRLDREVREEIAVTSTFTESDLPIVGDELDDRDYDVIFEQAEDVVRTLQDDSNSRRAIALTDEQACIVGVQVLVRDYVHVIAWLRSSDVNEYRTHDLGFLRRFGGFVRTRLEEDLPLRVHVFTSSMHEVVA